MRLVTMCAMTLLLVGCNEEATLTGRPATSTSTNPPVAGGNSNPFSARSVILQNLVRTEDSFGDIRILGEATATTPSPVAFVQITCTFKDAAGTTLGTDFTYVVGRVVKMSSSGINTNSALANGDTGYFDVLTSRSDASVASYACTPTFSTSPTTSPSARLEAQSAPSPTSDFRGRVMYAGSAKNIGSSPLIFGQVFAVSISRAGSPLDISFSYISGQTAVLSTGGTTNTGLDVERTAPFSIDSGATFSDVASTVYLYDWTDVASLGTTPAATVSAVGRQNDTLEYEAMHAARNERLRNLQIAHEAQ